MSNIMIYDPFEYEGDIEYWIDWAVTMVHDPQTLYDSRPAPFLVAYAYEFEGIERRMLRRPCNCF